MTRPYREVEKPFATRTLELVQALQLVADSVLAISQGRTRYLITLSGQLRALLTERSKGAKPLLLDIANELQQQLRIFCMPGVDDPQFPSHLRKDLFLHVSGFPITPERQLPAQQEISLSDLLNLQVVAFRDNHYPVKTIIEWYANRAGGAHYSTRLPEDFAALLMMNPLDVQPLLRVLFQIGEAVLAVGRQLLKKLVNVEIHAVLIVPSLDSIQVSDVNYVLDSQYEGSSMRLSLVLNRQLIPSFFARGLQGVSARVDSDRLIDWSKPRHVYAGLRIEDDLSTVLELAVDGVRVGRSRIDEPLFVLSNPLEYDRFHNKSADGPPQEFSFGLAHISIYGAELNPLDSAKLFSYIDNLQQDKDLPISVYSANSYRHARRGSRNFEMTGTVTNLKASDIIRNNESDNDNLGVSDESISLKEKD